MDRRELLKMITALTGGAVIGGDFFLAGCKNPDAGPGVAFSEKEMTFWDEVGETIFPKTSSPGAKEAKIAEFMKIMVNDTYTKEDQDIFHVGIKKIDEACNKMHGHDFMKASPEHRKEVIISIDKERGEYQKSKKTEDPNHYFQMVKQLTILGYFTSEQGKTGALRYEPVPGKYIGDYDYRKGDKIIAGLG